MPPIFAATGWSAWAAALALAGAGAIVLLYLLRRRPVRRVVPSTLLWERALREAVARSPWQRLRNQLPLWLEVLAAVALALALARPLWPASSAPLPGAVWVVDASASMHAGDRWTQALQAVEADLRRAGGGFRGALVWAGPVPEILVGPDATAQQLRAAVAALRRRRPTGAVADWQTSLALAYGAAARLPAGSPIRLVTDGSDPGLRESLASVLPGDRPVEQVAVGEPADNTGVLAVAVATSSAAPGGAPSGGVLPDPGAAGDRPPGGGAMEREGEGGTGTGGGPSGPGGGSAPTGTPQGGVTVTATLAHFGRQPVETHVLLEVDGKPPEVRPLRLQPGGVQQVAWTLEQPARLYRVALAPGDAYSLDDVAWAVAQEPERIRIALVGSGPTGLIERALRLHPGAEVVHLDAGQAGGDEPTGRGTGNGYATGNGDEPRAGTLAGDGSRDGNQSGTGNGHGTGGRDRGGTEGREDRGASGAGSGPEPGAAGLEGYDLLVVVGRPLPAQVPDPLPVIWINPPEGAGRSLGPAFAPRHLAAGDHPETARVLSHVDLDSFQLLAARPLNLEPGELPLIMGDGRPVATLRPAGAGGAGRAVLAFDPYQGTLLLRPAWPLLVQNLLAALAPGGFGLPGEATAGEPLLINPSPLLTHVTVTDPQGAAVPPGERMEQPGLYRATARTASGQRAEAFLWVRPHPGESRAVSAGTGVAAGSPGAGGSGDGAVAGPPANSSTGQGQPAGSPAAGEGPGPAGSAAGAMGAATAAAAASPYWRIPAFIALVLLILDAWVVRRGL